MPLSPLLYGIELAGPPRTISLGDEIAEWGYDREDFDGAITLLDLIADEDGPFLEAVARQAFASRHSTCTTLYHMRTKEQGAKWVLDRIRLAASPSGTPCVYGCLMDVDDLVKGGAWPFSEPTAWLEDGRTIRLSGLLERRI